MKSILAFLLFSGCSSMDCLYAMEVKPEKQALANIPSHVSSVVPKIDLEINNDLYQYREPGGEWDKIPAEIRIYILSFLTHPCDVLSFSQASKFSQQLSEELYHHITKEDMPLFSDSASPWQTTYIFRKMLLTLLREHQDHVVFSKKQLFHLLGENCVEVTSQLGFECISLGSNGSIKMDAVEPTDNIKKFLVFCEREELPHSLLLNSIFVQQPPLDSPSWQECFVKKFDESVQQEDELALELALILHSLDFFLPGRDILRESIRFQEEPEQIASLIEKLIEKGRRYIVGYELTHLYSDDLLTNLGICLMESNHPSASVVRHLQIQAVNFFAQATKNDFWPALASLGFCRFYGKGVRQDLSESLKQLSFAADLGDTGARSAGSVGA